MTKWEYKIHALSSVDPRLGGEPTLNELGSEGWEACGFWESSKEEKVWIIFKRVSK